MNGSFETGDMVGWTFAPFGPETWTVLSSGQPLPPVAPDYSQGGGDEPTDPLFGFGLPATEGGQLAYFSSNYAMSGPVPAVRMYQDVVLPPTPVALGWDMAWQSGGGFAPGQQSIRVLLRDASTDALLAVLWDSAGEFPIQAPLSSLVFPVAAFAGLEVRVDLEVIATLAPLDVQFDNFRLL